MSDAQLTAHLHKLRAKETAFLESEERLIGALAVGIAQAERFPDDGPLQTFIAIAEKAVNAAAGRQP